jgi:hypothetical protein
MKSLFLIFALTTSFSPLIFTSDSDSASYPYYGAAAAVAAVVAVVAVEESDKTVMACPDCGYREANKEMCDSCGEKLIPEKIFAEIRNAEHIAHIRIITAESIASAERINAAIIRAAAERAIEAEKEAEKTMFCPGCFRKRGGKCCTTCGYELVPKRKALEQKAAIEEARIVAEQEARRATLTAEVEKQAAQEELAIALERIKRN